MPTPQPEHNLDPWAPPEDGAEWFADPLKRAHHIAHLERHNEQLYLEALAWLRMWRAEMAADAEDAA